MSRRAGEFDIDSELRHEGLVFAVGNTLEVANEWQLGNPDLPVYPYKCEITETIADNAVTIITAQTGTGKSTQIPQYLLETEQYNQIIVSQPRRLAANNVFSRIKEELSNVFGVSAIDYISLHHAAQKEGPENAAIKIVTDGLQVILELMGKGASGRDVLVIDETHEANSNIEILLALAKERVRSDPNFRVVLMSAKMDTNELADYFADVTVARPPIMELPGEMHEVEVIERPESTVATEVVQLALSMKGTNEDRDEAGFNPKTRGDVLAFLPGKREIEEVMHEVKRRLPKDMHSRVKLFALHRNLSPSEQDAAIRRYPNHIKFIFATNIAESSITVDGLKYVVDAGLNRQEDIDDEGTKGLQTVTATTANFVQRMGRVGRTSKGTYISTRINQDRAYTPLHEREMYPVAQILRTDMQRNSLRLRVAGYEARIFDWLHKTSGHILKLADVNLVLLDAVGPESGAVAPIGRSMNEYPLCTSSARIMVESAGYPRPVRSYLAAMTASKELGGLQFYGRNVSNLWRELSEETQSDLLVQLDLFIAAQHMTDAELRAYGFDVSNVHRAREQYTKIAKTASAYAEVLKPPTEEERDMILECSLIGFMPAIYHHKGEGKYANISNSHSPTLREISTRSRVGKYTNPDFVVGDPWRVELQGGGFLHLIHNVTAITEEQVARLAAKHTVWRVEDYRVSGTNSVLLDKVVQVERAYAFNGFDLKQEREVEPEPSYALRLKIIEEALQMPGAEQRKIRQVKKELEELSHLTKRHVPQLTQQRLEQLIHEAAPYDITNPATIEDNLRLMSLDPETAITRSMFVPDDIVADILEKAPTEILVGSRIRHVDYRHGKPLVKVQNLSFVFDNDEDSVRLEDGREVYFVYRNRTGFTREYTLSQLRSMASYDLMP